MWYAIVASVSVLAGGYGGYRYGRAVEAKLQGVLAGFKQAAQDIKKGF